MDASQWSRISHLFASAAELPTAERWRLLEAEPEIVRVEVVRLLNEHLRSGVLDRQIASGTDDRWSGTTLNGRYRIERFLARGGAGAVYLARDEQIAGRAVVVKFLERQDAWLRNKFRAEMEALARIDHHGVVGILDAGETADGVPFLVIEYIDGMTLRSEIQKGPLDIARVARFIRHIGDAVSAAHEKGVLHRDLKPENIMLERAGTPGETVRLIDFGIASLDRSNEEMATQTTRFAGTTMYMAPEQLVGRPEPASDIYAIGVIAYEMLTGGRPFVAASPVDLYERQRAGVRSGPRRAGSEIPPSAARAVLKQLSFRPQDRSASALEASEEIALALEGKVREAWPRRRVTALLASGAGLAAGGTYLWRRSRPLDPAERAIELPMGTEPLENGFQKNLDLDYHVLPNDDATGFDSMRVVTGDQGSYSHAFSAAQAHHAQRAGWKLTFQAAVEDGDIFASIDNPLAPCRFVAFLLRTPGQPDSANLMLHAAPVKQYIGRPLPGPAGARRRVVMTWRPLGQAELWVDDVRLIGGYLGEPNFRYARGLEFGAGRWRSARGAGVFWNIRVEIG
jgi:serine/threonine protein kinase